MYSLRQWFVDLSVGRLLALLSLALAFVGLNVAVRWGSNDVSAAGSYGQFVAVRRRSYMRRSNTG